MEPSELILMDKTYKDRIMYRRQLLKDHHDVVIQVRNEGTDPRVRAAVGELYNFTMGFYLPTRYPRMFKLVTAEFDKERTQLVQNLVTGELLPTDLSANRPASSALETLAKTVDEDMLILLPQQKRTGSEKKKKNQTGDVRRRNVNASGGHSSSADGAPATSPTEDTKYVLEAYEVCYPAGFDSRTKLGKRLADIHGPVPGYAEKIEKSMDRFFEKLEVGKFVKRANWGITTDSDLFSAFGGIHAAKGEKLKPLAREDLDVDNVSNLPQSQPPKAPRKSPFLLPADSFTLRRLFSAANARRSIAFRKLEQSYSRSTLTAIRSGRSKKKVKERILPQLSRASPAVACLPWAPISGCRYGERL
jgi:hypothetical protein